MMFRRVFVVGTQVLSRFLYNHQGCRSGIPKYSSFTAAAPASTYENPYEPKPEIKHMFREKEKTPPSIVSNTFSVLCVAPLLLLFILWIKLGANLSNFPCSIYAAGFHLGLASIFALFVCFWLHLDMFATLKYLIGLGILTYLSGHRLLSKLAAEK